MITSTENPCKSVWDEYREKKLTREEFNTAVFSFALSDPKCDYSHKAMPFKPMEILQAEDKFKQQTSALDHFQKKEAWIELSGQLRKRYAQYFREVDENGAVNNSNLRFLQEIYDFFKTRNTALAGKAQIQIRTHEAARYDAGYAA